MGTPISWKPEFLVNTTTANQQNDPSVVALADGRFVVVWADFSFVMPEPQGIRAQIYAADGKPIGTEFIVNQVITAVQNRPTVTALPDGGFAVAWQDGSGLIGDNSNSAIAARIFEGPGLLAANQVRVNTTVVNIQETPAITALANGNVLVTWTDWSRPPEDTSITVIRAQILSPSGAKVGGELVVNTTTNERQSEPATLALPDGGFVVAWTDNSMSGGDTFREAVRAQVYAADGTTVGTEILVNTTVAGSQTDPALAVLSDGRFVVVFRDGSQSSGLNAVDDIRMQVFDPDGTPSGGEVLVTTAFLGAQNEPAVAGLKDGRLVVAWADNSGAYGDTSARAIVAVVTDAEGNVSGGPFRVNDATAFDQFDPSITVLADGRFVISWTDGSLTGGDTSQDAVRAEIFDPREGRAVLRGGDGDDSFVGTGFGDLLFGGAGDDSLTGAGGADALSGGGANDDLSGGTGNDTLNGNLGRDTLSAGTGRDILIGGAGNDRLTGGSQSDSFVFTGDFGHDVVTDFSSADAEDLDLSGVSAITGFGDLVANHLQTDAVTGFALIVAGSSSILLQGVLVTDIGVGGPYSAADFLF